MCEENAREFDPEFVRKRPQICFYRDSIQTRKYTLMCYLFLRVRARDEFIIRIFILLMMRVWGEGGDEIVVWMRSQHKTILSQTAHITSVSLIISFSLCRIWLKLNKNVILSI